MVTEAIDYPHRKQLDILCLIYGCSQTHILKTVGVGPYKLYVGGEGMPDTYMGIPVIHDPSLPHYMVVACGVKD